MSLRPSSFSRSGGGGGGGALRRGSDKRNSNDVVAVATLDDDDDDGENQYTDDEEFDSDEEAQQQKQLQEQEQQREDPLLLALDDLEGRVVSALDDVKLHPGVRTHDAPAPAAATTVHDELATLLRPVLEVAAHTGPSVARTYYKGSSSAMGGEGLEQSVEDVYQRIVSDLVLPVMLEMAQSDTNPSKRVAALEFFRALYKECHKAGSWLDSTSSTSGGAPGGGAGSLQAGPYGPGFSGSSSSSASGSSAAALSSTPAARAALERRRLKRLHKEGEILRYWLESSIACTVPGVFTSDARESAVASRGVIAASASLRPTLAHIATRIKDADDRGATRLYNPAMRMVDGVLKKIFSGSAGATPPTESVLSACIKFLEIVCLCCSRKPSQEALQAAGRRPRGAGAGVIAGAEDFSLEDLPPGHPIITRESLEAISEYAFAALRGMALLGGQVKIDAALLLAAGTGGSGASTTSQVISVLKPAALSYLELESTSISSSSGDKEAKDPLNYKVDRSRIDFDFELSQKSYALTISALSAVAINRPVYFKEASVCLARRAVQPPIENHVLSRSAVLALTAQLKGSCLTLLRNSLSIATQCWEVLHRALESFGMNLQADKALSMARQATALKTAGRAARNRANMYYAWDEGDDDGIGGVQSKRQRETTDALAQMRAAKAARGLGHGIQLPVNMTQAVELVLLNLPHLPSKRPSSSAASKDSSSSGTRMTLDLLVDAILSNGASLSQKEGRWYERDGGSAWTLDMANKEPHRYSLSGNMLDTMRLVREGSLASSENDAELERRKVYYEQCQSAAGDALVRILSTASYSRSKSVANLGNQIAARLAFTLGKVAPPSAAKASLELAIESVKASDSVVGDEEVRNLEGFIDSYPLVAVALTLDASTSTPGQGDLTDVESNLSVSLLSEALLQSSASYGSDALMMYDQSLDVWVATAVRAGRLANDKPTDPDRKRVAARATASLQRNFATLPRLTKASLLLVASMCDIEDITKKAAEASRKTSQDSIAASAAAHAARVAAEKRATAALVVLRDAAFQRSREATRKHAVECAVGLASGRLPSTPIILDKALKLCMNVLYAKSDSLADLVVECATSELEFFSSKAVQAFAAIEKANIESSKDDHQKKNPMLPQSDEEKLYMNVMRHPAVLYMALCIRRPAIIEKLFRLSSVENANVLAKTVRSNMPKLARAAAAKYGSAEIAMRVASMSTARETPLLLSFLESLAPGSEKSGAEDEIIEACFKIQDSKADDNGKKDARFVIPVVSVMKRKDLIAVLPEFVAADEKVFLAALVRMGDRLQRQALLFRDEPDEENPSLHGMTLCEQLVYLHRLDFAAAGLPQKQYLSAIKACLEDSDIYNDRIVMSALDHMSGIFLANEVPLPLAFMRTVILTCTKHESLRSWISHVLLPRLIEGKIYEDARQWEGWMRCAHMIEKSGDPNVSSKEVIQKLPPEQLMQYQTKWAGK
jgi:symplekin